MEMLWRTGLVCTFIVVMVATQVAGGHKDEFAQSQGETTHSLYIKDGCGLATGLVSKK